MGLSAQDVADVRVTDEYRSKHNGITHVWLQQQHAGIPVFNALIVAVCLSVVVSKPVAGIALKLVVTPAGVITIQHDDNRSVLPVLSGWLIVRTISLSTTASPVSDSWETRR